MSHGYASVQWNRQKRRYDLVALALAVVFLGLFALVGQWLRPFVTLETLLIRASASCAFVILHVILSLGPLSRLDSRWLPLLYNRRHLGVIFFGVCTLHAALSLMQFHGFGAVTPLMSLLTSNGRFESVAHFPFQLLGAGAWIIFLLMAVTSHDFWLANLSAPVWKALHMGVYLAYGLILGHVALGAGQSQHWAILLVLTVGAGTILVLHSLAARRSSALDRAMDGGINDEWVFVGRVGEIEEGRARILTVAGERVAVFRDGGSFHALSNLCQHQNGPLGEGRLVDGCVTCPWHGFQYDAVTGAAPPPFEERVPTFDTDVRDGQVFVATRPRVRCASLATEASP
jgi:nitrite reductase/ring-hydroxylating ferredoxin subunit/DMSO/TMAO reductase YedYZ heme-binding membrane subunit